MDEWSYDDVRNLQRLADQAEWLSSNYDSLPLSDPNQLHNLDARSVLRQVEQSLNALRASSISPTRIVDIGSVNASELDVLRVEDVELDISSVKDLELDIRRATALGSDDLKSAANTWQSLKSLNLMSIVEYDFNVMSQLAATYPEVNPLPNSLLSNLPNSLSLEDLLEDESFEVPDEITGSDIEQSLDSLSTGLALMIAYLVLCLDYPYLWVALKEVSPFIQATLWVIALLILLERKR